MEEQVLVVDRKALEDRLGGGMFVTEERLAALKAAGVMACSFSLDGPDAASHDAVRGVPPLSPPVPGGV